MHFEDLCKTSTELIDNSSDSHYLLYVATAKTAVYTKLDPIEALKVRLTRLCM